MHVRYQCSINPSEPLCGLSPGLTLSLSVQSCSQETSPESHPVLDKDDVPDCSKQVPVIEGAATPTGSTFQENAMSPEPTFLSSLSVPDFCEELEKTMDKFQANLEKDLKIKLETTLVKDLSRVLSPSQHT